VTFRVLTPIKQVVEKLKGSCNNLIDAKVDGPNLKMRCVNHSHKQGNERRPSAYLLLEDTRDAKNRKLEAGLYSCFGCKTTCGIDKFVQMALKCSYEEAIGWLTTNCETEPIEYEKLERITILELDSEVAVKPRRTYNLSEYENYCDYLIKRGISPEVISKFGIGFEVKTSCVTFPIYTNGELDFVAKRNTKTKFFELPRSEDMLLGRKPSVYIDQIEGNSVIICESVIDALTCWTYGKEAVALFGTGTDFQAEDIFKGDFYKVYLAFDNDEAGISGTKRFIKHLREVGYDGIIKVLEVPIGKDINDLSKEEFCDLFS